MILQQIIHRNVRKTPGLLRHCQAAASGALSPDRAVLWVQGGDRRRKRSGWSRVPRHRAALGAGPCRDSRTAPQSQACLRIKPKHCNEAKVPSPSIAALVPTAPSPTDPSVNGKAGMRRSSSAHGISAPSPQHLC